MNTMTEVFIVISLDKILSWNLRQKFMKYPVPQNTKETGEPDEPREPEEPRESEEHKEPMETKVPRNRRNQGNWKN
jgi:hypothetical protein